MVKLYLPAVFWTGGVAFHGNWVSVLLKKRFQYLFEIYAIIRGLWVRGGLHKIFILCSFIKGVTDPPEHPQLG